MNPLNSPTPIALLAQVVAGVAATNAQYWNLIRPTIAAHPIPYWGDPKTAICATFGVNPSAEEFTQGRWPQSTLTVTQLHYRLVHYFNNPLVPPHRWFNGYETALNILSHSYRTDTVHLDLSPRATIAMSKVDRPLFLSMVSEDLKWFLSALALCTNVKSAIMSGSVTNAHYFDEFLRKYLPTGYSLRLRIAFAADRGSTRLYDFVGPSFKIPVLFCGSSPSSKNKGAWLASEIQSNLTQLKLAGF